MLAEDYWRLFMESGAPEFYLMYDHARKLEGSHVPDDTGFGAAGHGLQ